MLASAPAAAQTVAVDLASRATGASRSRPSAPISSRAPEAVSSQGAIDDGLKALIADGPVPGREDQQGRRPHLLVTVVENPVIGRVAFEGNKKVKDEQLSAEVQSKPRGTFSRPTVQSDAQRIAEIYRRSGPL